MTTVTPSPNRIGAELLERLGTVPLDRIRFDPPPGTATIGHLHDPINRGCELVDGTLVEKTGDWLVSNLSCRIGTLVNNFIIPRNLGAASGRLGLMELEDGLIRSPDVAFVSWERLPAELPALPAMVPDFVVEVLSPGNTKAEMLRKREEYFRTGVRLVWEVDPRARTVTVFTAAAEFTAKAEGDTLTGEPALSGFAVEVSQIFAELDRGRNP